MWFRIGLNLLVVLIYLTTDGCDAAIPQIVQSIVTETKPIKGTAYLNCTVAMMNNDGASVKWIRMRDGLAISDDLRLTLVNTYGRFQVKKFIGRSSFIPVMPGGADIKLVTYTLIIKDLLRTDKGKYKCMVDQSGVDADKKPFAIGQIVVQSPAVIQPGPFLVPQVVNEFGTLHLECKADGEPTPIISWTRASGKPINVRLLGQKQLPQRVYGKTLIIKNMTREDRGMYRCHAQNNVDRSDEFDVVVEVNFPPKVTVARKDGYYAQSDQGLFQVALECIVSGYPSPDVRFYKGYYDPPLLNPPELKDAAYTNIERIYSYGAAGMSYDEFLYELRIVNVKSNAYGFYTCYAVNDFGHSNVTLTLASQPICQGPLCFLSQYLPSRSLSGSHLCPSPVALFAALLVLVLPFLRR